MNAKGSPGHGYDWIEDPEARVVWDLRIRLGLPWAEVTKQCGVDRVTGWKMIKRISEAIPLGPDEVESYVRQELLRLEEMEQKAVEALIRVDTNSPLDVDRCLRALDRVLARRARYLGLEAPKRIEIEGLSRDPLTEEVDRAAEALGALDDAEEET